MSELDHPLGAPQAATRAALSPSMRLVDAMRGRRWRIRTGVQDFRFEVQGSRDRRFEPGQSLTTLYGTMAGARAELVIPEVLVDALLGRAPEGVTLASLDHHDAALLFEHVLTEHVEATEAATDLPIRFERLERGGAAGPGGAWFEVAALDTVFPLHLTIQSQRVAEALASTVFDLDRLGPGVIPGMTVAIGPVNLTRDDLDALQPGDEVLLEGASLDRLVGAVLLDERHYWPIMLIDGGIVVDGPLVEADLRGDGGRPLSVFFVVGITAESSPMRKGDRMPLQRVDEKRMLLRLGDRVLGRAGLVNLSEGLAVRFFGQDGL